LYKNVHLWVKFRYNDIVFSQFIEKITIKVVLMMQVRNRLSVLMAQNNIRSVSELQRKIKDHGMNISRRTLDKFYNNESNRFDMDTLATLCVILNCEIGDLLVLVK
jgi:DNA-binding Xre family transcriptional regulator